jgi:hypothetical protein
MGNMYYIGLDVHKKTISYCVKDGSGRIHAEGKIPATRFDLDLWMKILPRPWTVAMEATLFTGRIYDHLRPHAAAVKVAHPLMLRAIAVCNDPGPLTEHEKFKEFDLPPEGRRKKFVAYLQGEIDFFDRAEKVMCDFSKVRERLESESGGVPEAHRLDRLMRYSTSLDREFERTLNQLLRLQQIRKGQPVPPTLNVNVST